VDVRDSPAESFRKAADLNGRDPRRNGNVVGIAAGCEVIAAGDVHGHQANLDRIIACAELPNHEGRRLVLQEILHALPDSQGHTGHDHSVEVLLQAVRLKIAHPEQVIFLLGNHDIAQRLGNEITKRGRGVCRQFVAGVRDAVGEAGAAEVLEAIEAFLLSMPIAARTPGGVLMCHTLPTPRRMGLAGESIPDGPYDDKALRRGGRVYEWTWGRKQTPEQVEHLAERLGVGFFILGHRHIDSAYEMIGEKAIILTAEHDRGCLLRFSSDAALTAEDLPRCLVPLASLAEGDPQPAV
jgi:hypothetical protein